MQGIEGSKKQAAADFYANKRLAVTRTLLDEALPTQPEANPPASAGPATFIEVCDAGTRAIYDKIWTNLKT